MSQAPPTDSRTDSRTARPPLAAAPRRLRLWIWLLVLAMVGPCAYVQTPREVARWYLAAAQVEREAQNKELSNQYMSRAQDWAPEMPEILLTRSQWRRDDGDFAKGRYARGHVWRFDGGVEAAASASPAVVPKPFADESAIDPEEALVASLSSCHMLTFLDVARRAGFVVDSYEDSAEGEMERLASGRWWIAKVTLRPRIVFSGGREPTQAELDDLHHKAHEACFIANSVKTRIEIEPPRGA